MNRIHAIVWNASLGLWTVVAETARRHGKGRTVVAVAAGSLFGAALFAPAAWGQAAPSVSIASGKTNAYVAGNGVTVVNIDTPNAAGLSHNRYLQYNVDPKGLVLNNGDTSQMARQSQLAGQVMANMNLGSAQARVILNEVVANNRSTLAGFTEVLGGRADVVLANPYGITCAGCGFINTDRVTLTTGLPFINADGTLGGFNVNGGDILVNGTGLNATAQQILDLVTRSVRLDAPVHGADVSIAAGANRWDYGTRAVTGAATASGSVPGYAIDSSALGGMYANRIRLTSTEAGVGVRMLADAAASADDFTLSAAGAVQVQARISAQRHLAIDSASSASQAIALTDASLTAGQDLSLRATQGGVALAGGALVAGHDLAVSAGSLVDGAGAGAGADANRRHAGNALLLASAAGATLGGTTWDSAGSWVGGFGSLSLGSGTRLAAGSTLAATTQGDMDLGSAAALAGGDLSLTSGAALRTVAGTGQGVQSTGGAVALTAAGALTNAGAVSADHGAVTVRTGGALANSGQIHAGSTLDIADANGAGSQAITNSGQLLADGAVAIQGAALTNAAAGWIQGRSGSTITADSLDNAGTLLLSQQATAADQVAVAGTLANSGTLQSAGNATVTAAQIDNTGTLLSAGDLQAAATGTLRNTGAAARMQAARQLTLDGAGITNDGALRATTLALRSSSGLTNTGTGTIDADTGDATLRVDGVLANSGQVHAGTTLDIADHVGAAGQTVRNSGRLLAGDDLQLQAASIDNQSGGWIQASTGTAVDAGTLTNAGTWLTSQQASASDRLTVGTTLDNTGRLQSAGNLTASAVDVDNSGAVLAAGNLTASAAAGLANASGAALQAGQALSLSAGTALLDNQGMLKGASVQLTAGAGLANAGSVSADTGAATLRVNGTFTNAATGQVYAATALDIADRAGTGFEALSNSGVLWSDGTLALKAAGATNTSTGWIQSATGSTVAASSLANAGAWLLSQQDGASSQVTVSGTLTNSGRLQSGSVSSTGTVQTTGSASLSAQQVDNSGAVLATGQLDVDASTLTNTGTGAMQGVQSLDVATTGSLTNQSGGKLLGDKLAVSADTLTNAGTLQAGTGNGKVSARQIANAGTVQSLGKLALEVGSGGLSGAGAFLANGDLTMAALNNATYTASIGGALKSGGLLTVAGNTGSSLVLERDASASGNQVLVGIGTLQLKNGSGADPVSGQVKASLLSSQRDMELNLQRLLMDGAYSRIAAVTNGAGAGQAAITVGQAFTNNGLVLSHTNLSLTAPSITNNASGSIAALDGLTLQAKAGRLDLAAALDGAAGVLDNAGLLYAGNTLQAQANGKITNTGTIKASDNDATHALNLTANTFLNNGEIDSGGSIRIVAATLSNGSPTLLTRVWNDNFGSQVGTAWSTSGEYDDGDAGGNVDKGQDFRFNYSRWQTFAPGVTLPTITPQITGRDVSLYFTQGHNIGGTIQGTGTVLMQGFSRDAAQTDLARYQGDGLYDGRNGFQLTGGAFTNDSLQLLTESHTVDFTKTKKLVAAGPAVKYDWHLCQAGTDYYDSICHHKNGYADDTHTTSASASNAGIYAGTLRGYGFSLSNNGATAVTVDSATNSKLEAVRASGTAPGASGATPPSQAGSGGPAIGTAADVAAGGIRTKDSAAAVGSVSAVSYLSANRANGVNGTSFGGINITLPTSPNGLFVTVREPGARYLVETNPLYTSGSSAVGSDYLARLLGYNPDQLSMRLGDAGYEAWLVKQQLIKQAGMAVLAGYISADAQMQGLMESAVSQKTALKLEYGKALTPEQQAALQQDIVWMVQTEIDGQTVLAPVVYLAKSTKDKLASGAVISAQDANLSLTSLTNSGGTIVGGSSLVIASAGDITNLSGLIKGGNVSLTSTEGSIVNKTASSGSGTDTVYVTDIGKSAGIEATGALALDAKKDISNIGATMTAGTDASLKAGGNITFDTIENKTTGTSYQNSKDGFVTSSSSTTRTTVEQVKSGLTVGGNLQAQAGNDITLAGTDAKVGGNADLQAGGNLNIVARENTTTTHSESKSAGLGQGGALYGSTETTTDALSVRNVGSTLQVGGNAGLAAKNDITIQGSDVAVKGSGSLNAANVNILAGRNYDESTTTTKTTAVGKVMDSGSSGGTKTGTQTAASSRNGKAQASAEGSASAGNTASGGLALYTSTETTTTNTDLRHVGSSVSFGGDLAVNARNDVNLQGSKVSGGGNVTVNATNVNLLAAEDKKTSTTTSNTTSVGFMGTSENKADASGGASASAYGGKGAPNAKAGVSGEANASTDNKLALYQGSKSSETTVDTTHQGSAITSGGSMTINAANNLTVQGSDLASGGDMTLQAKDMRFEAVNDTHTTTRTSESTSVGLYASGSANANANAGANAGIGAQAGASASASVQGEAGLYGEHNKSGSIEGSTTARTSSISAGGNLTRTAGNSITDVGTRADVKGDLTQSAQTITSLAASNTTFSSSTSEDVGVRVGAYAEAGVSAQAQAGVGPRPGGQASVAPGVGAGIRASAQYDKQTDSASSSTAVVSTFKVGGSVTSTSTGATRMEGTQIEAGKNVTLNAGSLEYTAAHDTSSSSSGKVSGGGSVGVDLVNKSASVSASGSNEQSSERSSNAVVGGIKAGGGISVNAQGDARFEGTQIESGGATSVKAGGSLTFDAAKNTSESSSSGVSASAGITAGAKEGSGNLEVGYGKSSASGSKDVVASIKSGGGITTQSGGDTTLVGTTVAAQGDINVKAGGNLKVEAAHETQTSDGMHVDVSGGGGKQGVAGKKYASTGDASVGGGFTKSSSDTATGATITSGGGNVNLSSGKDTTLVGTQVQAQGQTTVAAGGTVTQKAAVSTSSSSSAEVSASASGGSMQPQKKKGGSSGGGTGGAGGNKKKTGAVGSGILEVETTSDSSSSSQNVSLGGGQGVVVSQGGNPAKPQIAAAVALPTEGRKTGPGAAVVAKTADGKPLPSWLKFDPKTGQFTGTPPAGYKGNLKVNVSIPMADGTTQTRTVSFGK